MLFGRCVRLDHRSLDVELLAESRQISAQEHHFGRPDGRKWIGTGTILGFGKRNVHKVAMELTELVTIGRNDRYLVFEEELADVYAMARDAHELIVLSHVVDGLRMDLPVGSQ